MNGDEAGVPDADDYIIVPRWDEFQHYKNRNPLWIKVYSRLLHNPEYLRLSLASKGLLQVIWLGYAQGSGVLSVRDLATLVRPASLGAAQLVSLNHAGFIEWSASKPLAPNREVEVEKESPSPLTDQAAHERLLQEALDVTAEWGEQPSDLWDERIDQLEKKYESELKPLVRQRLWDTVYERARQARKADELVE